MNDKIAAIVYNIYIELATKVKPLFMENHENEKCIDCSILYKENNYYCIWNSFIADPYTTDACADFSPENMVTASNKLVEDIFSHYSDKQ